MFFSILEYTCFLLFTSRGSEALQIKINTNVTATIEDTNVELWCSYIKDGGEYIFYIQMQARNKTSEEYLQIATFYPPESNSEADLAVDYLTGRVSLTNPTDESSKAILTFNKIQCVDDTDYICSILHRTNRIINTEYTSSTSITVRSPSAKPDRIIPDLPLSGVEDGQYVSFVCKGNVGKPPGKFIWKKLRHGERNPNIYSNVSTTSTEIPGNCTFYGTSNLTIQLTEMDNKAKIQCVEESNLSSQSLTIETESITVYCPSAKPDSIIANLPLSGVEDGQYVSFVCTGNVGKPPAKFIWKKLRHGEQSPIIYSNVSTTSTEILGNCAFNGTSNLTIQLTYLDNKAKIQCVEESNLSSESLTIETESITVYYRVRNVVITKSPDRDMIVADDMNQVNLSSEAEGNPSVSFIWYKEPDMNYQLSNESLLMINDLSANTSGIYACRAYNIINDQMYNITETINVTIGSLLEPDEEEFETTGLYIALATGIGGTIAGLIPVMGIVIVVCIRRRRSANDKLPDNPNQQCVNYSTGDDKNNTKSNTNPNDINEDVYNHLGDVLRNHTTSPEATGNIYGCVGQS